MPTARSPRPRTAIAAALAIAAAVSAPAHATDLTTLPGLTVTSSFDFPGAGPSNGPRANILDNDLATYWNGGDFSGWVQVDFGATYVFDQIDVYGAVSRFNNFGLAASNDGVNFTPVASGSYGADAGLPLSPKWGEHFAFTGAGAPQGRYLRYDYVNGADWAHMGELEVQGHLPAVPEASTTALMACGLGALALLSGRRRRG